MTSIRLISMLAIIGVLSACASVESKINTQITKSGATQLIASEIESTLIGNTLYLSGETWEWAGYYQKGTMSGRALTSNVNESSTGAWEATAENQFCRTWKKYWGDAKFGCFKLYKVSDTEIAFVAASGSATSSIITLKPGNPYEF